MNRRSVLAGAAVAAVASGPGCLESLSRLGGPEFQQATDPWSNVRRDEGATRVEIVIDVALETGRWAAWELRPEQVVEYTYELTVETGNPAEILVFDRREFDRFREGESISHYTDFHATGTTPSATSQLNAGDYILIVDNTHFGEQEPEGQVRGELSMVGRVG